MKTSYIDLIDQTFYFPQEEFDLKGDNLTFHGIDLMGLIEKYGTPLRLTYLPRISENIQRAKRIFAQAMQKNDYHASYNYCYCTKSSHYSFILHEALKNDIHIETSSAYDIPIVEKLIAEGRLAKDSYILCNGFKRGKYIDYIARLINTGHPNTIPIIDNEDEIDYLCQAIDRPFEIGIRIASEEEPKFTFYTSRLGIKYRDIAPLHRRDGTHRFDLQFRGINIHRLIVAVSLRLQRERSAHARSQRTDAAAIVLRKFYLRRIRRIRDRPTVGYAADDDRRHRVKGDGRIQKYGRAVAALHGQL